MRTDHIESFNVAGENLIEIAERTIAVHERQIAKLRRIIHAVGAATGEPVGDLVENDSGEAGSTVTTALRRVHP